MRRDGIHAEASAISAAALPEFSAPRRLRLDCPLDRWRIEASYIDVGIEVVIVQHSVGFRRPQLVTHRSIELL